ncbi:hypothetical protein [Fluviispira sanaruensis]|uniref:Outer membrane protein beta-barrel domain-containing protein n=1 Tax=Fluviispira sanaruensis TaxID=2493639 RepID=A0A4P2VIA4_FLUSA|nr:hypothetical protein [Fluviispira sanaruensis]BBH52471.1 hypothetical protein JCM31447_09120 [Fluviispira sanaruensis]
MYIDAYQTPQENNIYIQQNLVSDAKQKRETDNIDIFINQEVAIKKINDQYFFPLNTEIGLDLNHSFQTAFSCNYAAQKFKLNNKDGSASEISNFWYCGNSFAYIPYASSIFHPKIKLFGGAGEAYGKQINGASAVPESLKFFTLKPSLDLEINVLQNLNFSLGTAYQFLFSNDSDSLRDQVSGAEAHISISLNFR